MRFLIFMVATVLLTACDQVATDSFEVQRLTAENSSQASAISELQQRLYNIETRLENAPDLDKSVVLTPASKDYAPAQTSSGVVLFALSDIQKFADGYKVKILIGNPNFVNITEIKLKVNYNISASGPETLYEWGKTMKTVEHTITGGLGAGTWTPQEIILSPATEAQTGWIQIEPIIGSVYLRAK